LGVYLEVLEGAKEMLDATTSQLVAQDTAAGHGLLEHIGPSPAAAASPDEKRLEVYRTALELYAQKPDWATFFRKVLGTDGLARALFPAPEQMAELERSEEYAEIQQMLARLRASTPPRRLGTHSRYHQRCPASTSRCGPRPTNARPA
jgi:hypothetical protein